MRVTILWLAVLAVLLFGVGANGQAPPTQSHTFPFCNFVCDSLRSDLHITNVTDHDITITNSLEDEEIVPAHQTIVKPQWVTGSGMVKVTLPVGLVPAVQISNQLNQTMRIDPVPTATDGGFDLHDFITPDNMLTNLFLSSKGTVSLNVTWFRRDGSTILAQAVDLGNSTVILKAPAIADHAHVQRRVIGNAVPWIAIAYHDEFRVTIRPYPVAQ